MNKRKNNSRSHYGRTLLLSCLFIGVILVFKSSPKVVASSQAFHTDEDYSFFAGLMDSLPRGFNGLFAASGECVQCHGFDTAMIASVDPLGNDINLVDDWRATMMANSARDPFWRAKVSHEVATYPQHQQEIEASCIDCHAPLGYFAAIHQGAASYSIAEMAADSIAMDGVSCLACHQQPIEGIGNGHSGDLKFDTIKVAYGPFVSPLSSPMLEATNYEPVYSEHISDSGVCAACHSLITETFDYEGELTGTSFVEQATYHEWLNSAYVAENTSCQECHMPVLSKGQFNIAAGFPAPPRDRFYLHELAGANVTMLKILRDNAAALGVTARPEDFENVINATENMLRFKTLTVELIQLERTVDTLFVAVKLTNRAGHKFPSGYPSRRAFIHLKVKNEANQTLFNSGQVDENFEVYGQNPTYEPHYTTIRSADEVQIYEQVMGDVNGDVTTTLTRASFHIKDNRIPPRGFRKDHEVYDTTAIAGLALEDVDFNLNDLGEEGSGSDIVYYHIPLNGELSPLDVSATVYYQSMPPKWMDEMFGFSTAEIELFRAQFAAADRTPSLVGLDSIFIDELVGFKEELKEWTVEMNVLRGGELQLTIPENMILTIYTLQGQQVLNEKLNAGTHSIMLHYSQKVLIAQLQKGQQSFVKKLWMP